jgi:hypothetical protein
LEETGDEKVVEDFAAICYIVHVCVTSHIYWMIDSFSHETLGTVEDLRCFACVHRHEIRKVRNEYHCKHKLTRSPP